MKIACAGDLHIDGPKRGTCERVLRAMYDDMAERGASAIVVPGDVYDALPSPLGQLFLRSLVQSVPSEIAQLYMPGNHDPAHVLGVVDAFGARSVFANENVTVVEEPRVVDLEIDGETLRVACLPDLRGTWIKKRLAGMPKGSTPLDVACAVLDDLAAQMDDAPGPMLFAGHLTIGGARMDNDQPARAPELAFKLSDIGEVPAHAYVFGHIHLRQAWTLNGAPAFYTGSPYATTYGEMSQKSWTMLHWNGRGFDVEIMPTKAPRLVLLVGTWLREGDDGRMDLAYHEAHETDRAVVLDDLAGAEVQVRYETPTGDRTGAERAAEEHRTTILAAGALACDVDQRSAVNVRSRAPELAAARTLPEKIDAFWRAKDEWPDAARRERIHGIVARLEPMVKPPPPVSLVRVDHMTWCGLGKLESTGTLPAGRAGVQVVTGPNEAGKSTLLSLFYAGMWGDGPKGTLDSLSCGIGARLGLGVTTAQGAWKLDHDVNRKDVTAWEGDEPKASGRASYKAWAKKNLPSPDVLEWTSFLPSEGKGLLGLTDSSLKAALLTLAGAPIFASLGELVADEAKDARALTKSLGDAVKRAGDPQASLDATRTNMRLSGEDIARKKQEAADITEALVIAAGVAETEDRVRFLRMQASELATQRAAAQAIVDATSVDVEAVAAFEKASEHLTAATSRVGRAAVEEDHAAREMADVQEQIERCNARAAAERTRAARFAEKVAGRAEAEEALAALPAAAERLADAEAAVTAAAAQQEQAGPRETLGEVRRIASGARLKPGVAMMDKALLTIRDMADAALAKPNRSTLSSALSERTMAEQAHAALVTLSDRLPEIEMAALDFALAEDQAEEEEQSAAFLTIRYQDASDRYDAAALDHRAASDEVKRWTAEKARLAPLASSVDATRAQHAVGQVALLQQQEEALQEQITSIGEALAVDTAHRDSIAAAWSHPVPASKTRLAVVQRELQTAERDLVRYEDRVASLEAAVTQLAADREALALAERDEGDLAELVRVLSAKGIQAYEADAIGNEIADVATELLQKHGFRWTLTYAPLREDVEQARWMLADLNTGLVFDARSKGGGASGGQGFVAMCAVFWGARAALCRRGGGVPESTATLDEMTGAVREPNVQPWLAMMRDGASRTGAKVLYLVPPNDQRLIDACDGVITVTPSGHGSIVE